VVDPLASTADVHAEAVVVVARTVGALNTGIAQVRDFGTSRTLGSASVFGGEAQI
jgi:hypothetical protein